MSVYLTTKFWHDALERAFKTFGQTALGAITIEAVSAGLSARDTAIVIGVPTLASVLMSIGSAKVGDDTASLVP